MVVVSWYIVGGGTLLVGVNILLVVVSWYRGTLLVGVLVLELPDHDENTGLG